MNTQLSQGDIVFFQILLGDSDNNRFCGHAVVRGISSVESPVLGRTYILEDLSGNLPNETYPYTHFVCPEAWLSRSGKTT